MTKSAIKTYSVPSTESFIEHAVNMAEIASLKWALKYWNNPNGQEMIEQYVRELEEAENGRD
jgi:hypothetical protein